MSTPEALFMESIGELVRARTGIELGCYRPSMLSRRVHNRMTSAGTSCPRAYLELLRSDEHEVEKLLERVTIKVSWLYRNPATFELLRRRILPQLRCLARPLRVWSAGCARGEEAYSLAMLLEEAGLPGTITATDVDRRALEHARTGRLDSDSTRHLPAELRARFVDERTLEVAAAVRRRVRFSLHDVTRPAPRLASRPFDLICCRNVLIYLKRAVQEIVQANLRSVLAEGGFLVLGEAEWPAARIGPTLEVISRSARIFKAIPPAEKRRARA